MKVRDRRAAPLNYGGNGDTFIEKVGSICYKSSVKDESASIRCVKKLVDQEHWAMLEHEHIYLGLREDFSKELFYSLDYIDFNWGFFNVTREDNMTILSGSFRAFHDLFVYLMGLPYRITFTNKSNRVWLPVIQLLYFFYNNFGIIYNNDIELFKTTLTKSIRYSNTLPPQLLRNLFVQ